ncbi:MAG: CBS domain-containing protein [Gemmatimonadota bacterium]
MSASGAEGPDVTCPVCGGQNLQGADHCGECGTSLTDLFGAELAEARFLSQPLTRLYPQTPECVPLGASVAEAVARLKGRNVGCVLVTAEAGRLVGIFTEGDVHYKVAGLLPELERIPVESLMTPRPSVLTAADTIGQALHLMGLHGFRHVPIVNDEGQPLAFIAFRDIVRFMEESLLAGAGAS